MSSAAASARWVGSRWPRTSLPPAMSAASASTMRRNVGPCHSESVGTQSMQFVSLPLIVCISDLIVGIEKVVKDEDNDGTGFSAEGAVARLHDEVPQLRARPPVSPLPQGRRPLRGLW